MPKLKNSNAIFCDIFKQCAESEKKLEISNCHNPEANIIICYISCALIKGQIIKSVDKAVEKVCDI